MICSVCEEREIGPYPSLVDGANVCEPCAELIANAYSKCHSGVWLTWKNPPTIVPKKGKIPRSLATKVFERDAYRCVACGGHKNLTCDHILAESKGGKTIFENLQTMCRSCNSRKGAR